MICWLGLGNPRHIATKTPLEKLDQNLGLADPPQKIFFQTSNLKAPLTDGRTHSRVRIFNLFRLILQTFCQRPYEEAFAHKLIILSSLATTEL